MSSKADTVASGHGIDALFESFDEADDRNLGRIHNLPAVNQPRYDHAHSYDNTPLYDHRAPYDHDRDPDVQLTQMSADFDALNRETCAPLAVDHDQIYAGSNFNVSLPAYHYPLSGAPPLEADPMLSLSQPPYNGSENVNCSDNQNDFPREFQASLMMPPVSPVLGTNFTPPAHLSQLCL